MHGQRNTKYYGGAVQASSLWGYDALMLSEGLPIFQRIVSPSSEKGKYSKKLLHSLSSKMMEPKASHPESPK